MDRTPAQVLAELGPFENEAPRNFTDVADQKLLEAAMKQCRDQSRHFPLLIDGQYQEARNTITSFNPAHPSKFVGTVGSASRQHANDAVEASALCFESWKRVGIIERSAVLVRAAELLRRRRDDFNALLVLEVGKSWIEADSDTAEAIDFLEFYAREALRYDGPAPLVPIAGEKNHLTYIPLGVGVVIPPWNFALAILVGMTSASVVTGNTVVLKPSSDAPVIAGEFVNLLIEAGLPRGVVSFVPGAGGEIGDVLVAHPKTRFIAFTGSKEVGLHINELASKTQAGQIWIKRVIAEMGGKDSIIVADDADIAAAVEGVTLSAFGFQGQKCSACSRAIVDAKIYDDFLTRLTERVKAISLGDPSQPQTFMGPVINQKAMRSILSHIETAIAQGGRLLTGGKPVERDGFFIEPTVIADVTPNAAIAHEEIFGPVLAVLKAKNYDDALSIANNTEFGLTGSVYSQDEAKLTRASNEFHVGNLYFNRKSTGAMVGAHPFGGFNMSGTDSKAGGYDYLHLFTQAKLVSRKI